MRAALLAVALVGCAAGPKDWTDQDVTQVTDIQRGSEAAYETLDGGIGRALMRADYCSATSVLVRHGTAAADGGGIQCSP